jgi:hypothetical protein
MGPPIGGRDLAKFGVGLEKPNNPDKIRSTPA